MTLSRKTIEDCLFILRYERGKQEHRYLAMFISKSKRAKILHLIDGINNAIRELETELKKIDNTK